MEVSLSDLLANEELLTRAPASPTDRSPGRSPALAAARRSRDRLARSEPMLSIDSLLASREMHSPDPMAGQPGEPNPLFDLGEVASPVGPMGVSGYFLGDSSGFGQPSGLADSSGSSVDRPVPLGPPVDLGGAHRLAGWGVGHPHGQSALSAEEDSLVFSNLHANLQPAPASSLCADSPAAKLVTPPSTKTGPGSPSTFATGKPESSPLRAFSLAACDLSSPEQPAAGIDGLRQELSRQLHLAVDACERQIVEAAAAGLIEHAPLQFERPMDSTGCQTDPDGREAAEQRVRELTDQVEQTARVVLQLRHGLAKGEAEADRLHRELSDSQDELESLKASSAADAGKLSDWSERVRELESRLALAEDSVEARVQLEVEKRSVEVEKRVRAELRSAVERKMREVLLVKMKDSVRAELRAELKDEIKSELQAERASKPGSKLQQQAHQRARQQPKPAERQRRAARKPPVERQARKRVEPASKESAEPDGQQEPAEPRQQRPPRLPQVDAGQLSSPPPRVPRLVLPGSEDETLKVASEAPTDPPVDHSCSVESSAATGQMATEPAWEKPTKVSQAEAAALARELEGERAAQQRFMADDLPEGLVELFEDHRLYQLWDQLEIGYRHRVQFRAKLLAEMGKHGPIDLEDPEGPLDLLLVDEVRRLRPQMERKAGLVELVRRREAQKRCCARQPDCAEAAEELAQLDAQLLVVLEHWQAKQAEPFEFRGVDYLKMMKMEKNPQPNRATAGAHVPRVVLHTA